MKIKLILLSSALTFGSISNVMAATVNCATLTSRTEKFNGELFTKYNVVDSNYMKCPQIQTQKPSMTWKVKKTTWSESDELKFGEFVKKIGQSSCNTVDKCMSQESNILRSREDMLFTHYSDCADFPYYLRSYFAYKSNLPFAMMTAFKQNPYSEKQTEEQNRKRTELLATKGQSAVDDYDARLNDLRYSLNGNYPTRKKTVPDANGKIDDFGNFGPAIMDSISSGAFRMTTTQPGYPESDFYSPAITREEIKAGTALYSPSGHVAIVYEVKPNGEILFIDAHPDNSVSRGVFSSNGFKLVNAKYGGNFKNFRPVNVVNPVYDNEGHITAGQVVAASDAVLGAKYSLEQYTGKTRRQTKTYNLEKVEIIDQLMFELPGSSEPIEFYDWVKFRLSGGTFKLNPIEEMTSEVNQLCVQAQDRVTAVATAIENQIHLKKHPESLPKNIFGADGEWEAYSSPSRDLRLRTRALGLLDVSKKWLDQKNSNYPLINYKGSNLKKDLKDTYEQAALACKITYTKSDGSNFSMTLKEFVENRLANISYDPYMCPEIRQGAYTNAELASCKDNQEKQEWHTLMQFLRNNLEKDTKAVHGYTQQELKEMQDSKAVDNTNTQYRYKISSKLEAM